MLADNNRRCRRETNRKLDERCEIAAAIWLNPRWLRNEGVGNGRGQSTGQPPRGELIA